MTPGTAPPRSTDVVVIGAGLAGLAAALRIHEGASGVEVTVLESADAVGGRVRTDLVDGLLLDRGFQLLNPSYPEARRVLDLDALDLQPFGAGVVVALGDRRHVLGDPLRLPSSVGADLLAPVAPLAQRLRLAAWAAPVGYGPARRVRGGGGDSTLMEELERRGLNGPLTDRVLRPFLAGVLAEEELGTSRRLAELLLRSFLRGRPSLPAAGMQAMPDQLASRLPEGAVHCRTMVRRVSRAGGAAPHVEVVTDDGVLTARAVVVATAPPVAARLLGWAPSAVPPMKALTTYWFRADEPPSDRPLLHVDGDRRGPLVNTAVVSRVAPGYARSGSLVASTVVGAHGNLADVVRRQTGVVYGVDPSGWELVRTDVIRAALPAFPAGTPLRRRVDLGDGLFVAGDHRDTPSIQGSLVSGRRAGDAVLASLRRAWW